MARQCRSDGQIEEQQRQHERECRRITKAGHQAGRNWVNENTHFDCHAAWRLAKFQERCERGEWPWDDKEDLNEAYTVGEHTYLIMWPTNEGARERAAAFWMNVSGKEHPSPKFVRAFMEGVIETYLAGLQSA